MVCGFLAVAVGDHGVDSQGDLVDFLQELGGDAGVLIVLIGLVGGHGDLVGVLHACGDIATIVKELSLFLGRALLLDDLDLFEGGDNVGGSGWDAPSVNVDIEFGEFCGELGELDGAGGVDGGLEREGNEDCED